MIDDQLLKLAAKAAGYEINFDEPINNWYPHGYYDSGEVKAYWNPLLSDGDALRLAVKLDFLSEYSYQFESALGDEYLKTPDKEAATRRAIVRAAAEVALSRLSLEELERDESGKLTQQCCGELMIYFGCLSMSVQQMNEQFTKMENK